jgi:hypothetical protein
MIVIIIISTNDYQLRKKKQFLIKKISTIEHISKHIYHTCNLEKKTIFNQANDDNLSTVLSL